MAFSFEYPTPLPSTKGWGPGWPNCQTGNIRQHPIFQGGVREELYELVDRLVAELVSRGYRFHDGWSWGFGCRATKGGDGDVPSFHSWGLGLDFNAPENPFNRDSADTAKLNNEDRWVVGLMREYGFFWLGPSIGDWMHFSFVGSPADARAMTEKARAARLGEENDVAFEDFKQGVRERMQGEAQGAKEGDRLFGWKFADRALSEPKPVAATGGCGDDCSCRAPHTHVAVVKEA